MTLQIEIQKKTKYEKELRTITKPKDVFELEEVQEIKDAVQEHLLFIGLDTKNNIRNVTLLGLGTSKNINIDTKYIVRIALITASDKVILVHNHPSNGLNPSIEDKHLTNFTNRVLKAFNIELLDHIIVVENGFVSMEEQKSINKDYEDSKTNLIDNTFLLEENKILKQTIKKLSSKIRKNEEEIEL